MKNKNIAVPVLIIIVAIAALLFLLRRHVNAPINPNADTALVGDKTFTFACADSKSITATFHLPDDKGVDVSLSDGRTFSLNHVISADGARYANADESLVLWNKGDSVFLNEKDVATYTDCNLVQ